MIDALNRAIARYTERDLDEKWSHPPDTRPTMIYPPTTPVQGRPTIIYQFHTAHVTAKRQN
jgi:hypothetical protein